MGMSGEEKPEKTIMSIKLDRDLLDMLDEFAMENQISRSEAVRLAIKMMIDKWLEEKKKKAKARPGQISHRTVNIVIGDDDDE